MDMRNPTPRILLTLTLATGVLAGCSAGADDRRAAEPTVRDSAGVRLVENSAPAWGDSAQWRVDPDPRVSIGVAEGDSMLLLSRVMGAARLSDGTIVIADGGSSQLRYFDATGAFRTATGRVGSGPGEFNTGLTGAWRLLGDTIVARDLSPRLSYFDAEGAYLTHREVMAPDGARHVSIVAQAGNGHYLGMSGRSLGADKAGRVITDSLQIIGALPDGTDGRMFTHVRAQERWGLQVGDRTSYPFLPFSSPSSWAAGSDQFAIGDGRTGTVAAWNTDATLRHVIRWDAGPRPVTAELRSRYREHRLENERDPNVRRRIEQFVAEAPVPDSLPVYRNLLVDASGHLWVEEYRNPWERDPTWQLFDPDGRWLGRVVTPARLTIFEIGDDYLLGRWLDEDNVEHVRLHALLKAR